MAAAVLVVIGFVTYYFIPLCFIKGRTTIMLLLLNLILIMIVVGITFLCTLVVSPLEKLILWISLHTCCRKDKKMYPVILKNMDAH